MKVTWEENDINVGRYFYINDDDVDVSKNLSYFASVTHKLGYLSHINEGERYIAVSIVDGMAWAPKDRASMATALNRSGYKPVPQDHLMKLFEHLAKVNMRGVE